MCIRDSCSSASVVTVAGVSRGVKEGAGLAITLSSPLFPEASEAGSTVRFERVEAPSVKGSDTVLPHESQNRAPVLNSVLQEVQTTVRREPHESQNLASSRLSFPQFKQDIYPSGDIYLR